MSTFEPTHDGGSVQRTGYAGTPGPSRSYSDGTMHALDTTVVIAVIVMFLGPLITAAFGPIN